MVGLAPPADAQATGTIVNVVDAGALSRANEAPPLYDHPPLASVGVEVSTETGVPATVAQENPLLAKDEELRGDQLPWVLIFVEVADVKEIPAAPIKKPT